MPRTAVALVTISVSTNAPVSGLCIQTAICGPRSIWLTDCTQAELSSGRKQSG